MEPSSSNQTGAATHAAVHQINQALKPEWLRIPEATRVFGPCRSGLYEMIAAGLIKSTVLRKRGATRGIRLISYDSLAAYIENSAKQQAI